MNWFTFFNCELRYLKNKKNLIFGLLYFWSCKKLCTFFYPVLVLKVWATPLRMNNWPRYAQVIIPKDTYFRKLSNKICTLYVMKFWCCTFWCRLFNSCRRILAALLSVVRHPILFVVRTIFNLGEVTKIFKKKQNILAIEEQN